MTAPAAAPAYPTEPCKSCGRPVIWCTTTGGRSMPVNADPTDGGNIRIRDRYGDGTSLLAEVLSVAKQFGLQGRLHTSHFVDCAQAKEWRRR